MDSDLIRDEIAKTEARIEQQLQILEERTRAAARAARTWGVVAVAAAGLVAALIFRRVRARPRDRKSSRLPQVRAGAVAFTRRCS